MFNIVHVSSSERQVLVSYAVTFHKISNVARKQNTPIHTHASTIDNNKKHQHASEKNIIQRALLDLLYRLVLLPRRGSS